MEHFREVIKKRLTPHRFEHSLNVSAEAVKIAKKYGGDVRKAEFAGLVHDIEKDTPPEVQLQTLHDYSIILDEVTQKSYKLYHAVSGAAVLEHEHNVTDKEILNAVRYHTTARAGMSLLEKIIYLADYISADRNYDGVENLRKAVYTSLDYGMKACLDFSIDELLGKHALIHLDTVHARNELYMPE